MTLEKKKNYFAKKCYKTGPAFYSNRTFNGFIMQWMVKLFLNNIKTIIVRVGFLTWPFESMYR